MRTNSGKAGGARKPIPVDTPRYFVLEQQPSWRTDQRLNGVPDLLPW